MKHEERLATYAAMIEKALDAYLPLDGTRQDEVIRAMAEMFDVPTSYLVDEDAVYVSPNDGRVQVSEEDIKFALFGGDGEITDEMYQEVQLFASFIKAREAAKKKE